MPSAAHPRSASSAALEALLTAETARFASDHPRSAALAAECAVHWQAGAPLHWMGDWPTPFPLFAASAEGATLTCADGRRYDDFCLGDTPAMFGHARPEVTAAVAAQMARGAGYMLPSALAGDVGALLAQRFSLPMWQATVSASDANRAVIRWARAATQRPVILVFDGCYHGMVDDAFVVLKDGAPAMKAGLVGQVYDMRACTRVVPFNDIEALHKALAPGDVAAVLAEPVMTNCGMILPEPGFHDALRHLTRARGTLLILDETHTLSAGPGGYARAHALEPDAIVIGKAIGGGVPAAAWGVAADLGARMKQAAQRIGPGQSGIGTTLAGNALALAAMHAMLTSVMTEGAFTHMRQGAARLAAGLSAAVARRNLSWSVVAAGARVELVFAAPAPRNAEAMRAALGQDRLMRAFHLFLINRGALIAPFHNMMLISPHTSDAAIDRLVAAVEAFAMTLAEMQ